MPAADPQPAQWTQEYGRRIVNECRRSGMDVQTFAKARGFSAQRIRWLAEQVALPTGTGPRVVELVPVASAAVSDQQPPVDVALDTPPTVDGDARLEVPTLAGLRILCPSGHVVVVDGGELESTLRTALRALKEVAC